jgi:hypothetical protein
MCTGVSLGNKEIMVIGGINHEYLQIYVYSDTIAKYFTSQ